MRAKKVKKREKADPLLIPIVNQELKKIFAKTVLKLPNMTPCFLPFFFG